MIFSKTKKYIFISVLIISLLIPHYMILDNKPNTQESSQNNSINKEQPFVSSLDDTFEEDYMYNLTEIRIIKGSTVLGNVDNLKFEDGSSYSCKGTYNNSITKYEFNIEFNFGANESLFYYDYFDLFFYLKINAMVYSDLVNLQYRRANNQTDYDWVSIVDIYAESETLHREYLENCMGFRLYGQTNTNKIITIDLMNFFMARGDDFYNQSNNLEFLFEDEIPDTTSDWLDIHHDNISNTWFFTRISGWSEGFIREYYENWTLKADYDHHAGFPTPILSTSVTNDENYIYATGAYYSESILKYYHNMTYIGGFGGTFIGSKWDIAFDGEFLWVSSTTNNNLAKINVSDYTLIETKTLPTSYMKIWFDGTFFWAKTRTTNNLYKYDNEWNLLNYYSYSDLSYIFDDYAGYTWADTEIKDGHWNILLQRSGYNFKVVQFDWLDIDVKIEDVYSVPTSPISTIENFDIRVELDHYYPNANVSIMFKNNTWESDWIDLTYDSGVMWKSQIFNINDYDYVYTIWVNASLEFYSAFPEEKEIIDERFVYNFTDINITNGRPTISFNTPQDLDEIIELYDLSINITVIDLEADPYINVSFRIYETGNEDNLILNWTEMEQFNILTPMWWNYTINPITIANGIYTIQARARDAKGFGYASIVITIHNDPPDIALLSPSLTTLTVPLNQSIICNITNEVGQPIIATQWDIVKTLGIYSWKNLIYNGGSEYYESEFSLLNYEYGAWYLVINATDEKNSSYVIKSLTLHPIITYDNVHVSFETSGILISYDREETDDLEGSVIITHNTIAKERDFILILPTLFDDAFEYSIVRGFNTYYPNGYNIEGIESEWNLPSYLPSDTVTFYLEKPTLKNEVLEEDDTTNSISLEFTVSSKHALENLQIHNRITKYLSLNDEYTYELEYKYEGEFKEYISGDLSVEKDNFITFDFDWDSIEENSTITFKFTATLIEQPESYLVLQIVIGSVLSILAILIYVLLYAREKWINGENRRKIILIGIGVAVGGFFGGYFLALMFV